VQCHPGDIAAFLAEAVKRTGLKVIMGPVIDEPLGIGFVVIAESHISVHVQGDRAFVDCFSCRRFNWGAVVGTARRTFGGVWTSRYFRRSEPPTPPTAATSNATTAGESRPGGCQRLFRIVRLIPSVAAGLLRHVFPGHHFQ
jgi:hypothetical protein